MANYVGQKTVAFVGNGFHRGFVPAVRQARAAEGLSLPSPEAETFRVKLTAPPSHLCGRLHPT
jgi:hypothetical protein